jgi:hypothetical protein
MPWKPLVAILVVSLSPSSALADWSATFPPAAVGSQLDRAGFAVLVAAGGAGSGPAASAVRKALRASGRARLVMDDSSIGHDAARDDHALVEACAGLPVDAVAVVRVFPGADDKQSAVVTIYDKQSAVLVAFTAEEGTPLAPRAGAPAAAPSEGVSNEATGAVEKVLRGKEHAPSSSAAQKEYDENYIGFFRINYFNQYGMQVGQTTRPYLGKYQKPLEDPADFFDAIGDEDRADEYREKTAKRNSIMIPGFIVMGIGALAAIGTGMALFFQSGFCYDSCTPDSTKAIEGGVVIGGLVLAIVGVAVIVTGATVKRPELTPQQMLEKAERHNKRLRKRLGLPAEEEQQAALPSFAISPTVSRDGGGLALGLRF